MTRPGCGGEDSGLGGLGGAEVEDHRLRFLRIASHGYRGEVVLLGGNGLRDVEAKVLLLRMQYHIRHRILDRFL
jgi:hypothetical protein